MYGLRTPVQFLDKITPPFPEHENLSPHDGIMSYHVTQEGILLIILRMTSAIQACNASLSVCIAIMQGVPVEHIVGFQLRIRMLPVEHIHAYR